ncbi:hypothetical protein ACO1O0_005089 [Amphichorda felina]
MSSEPQPKKVWASLITNSDYLPGLLTLHHSLGRVHSAYPLVALTVDSLPPAALHALHARGITTHLVPRLAPSRERDYAGDPRFSDTWTKLAVWSLTQYDRIVLLDSDMLVRRNMDELMRDDHLALDPSSRRVLAAGPACTCNPRRRAHYPPEWTPANCAFTAQHADPGAAQSSAPDPGPLACLNSGLLALVPSAELYAQILARMEHGDTATMAFPDQDLLADLFRGRWVALPYVYNALKTLRWEGVHDAIWRDDEVKNVHYILSPKPWNEVDEKGRWTGSDESHRWWWDMNEDRKAQEKAQGIDDGH